MRYPRQYKLSRYLIRSNVHDTTTQSDQSLVWSTRSGKIRILSAQDWKRVEDGSDDQLSEPLIHELVSSQILVSADENELEQIIAENRTQTKESRTLYYAIQPTAQCPLGCGYCGQTHSSKTLDRVNEILEFVGHSLDKKPYDTLSISWFGAEPLAAFGKIVELSKMLIQTAQSRQLKYSAHLTTNGLYLKKAYLETLLQDCMVRSIEVTLDGTSRTHDQRRHTKLGSPTFERILENIENFMDSSAHLTCKLSIRCNVDPQNADDVKPLIDLLHAKGWSRKLFFYIAPIHGWGNGAEKKAMPKEEFADRLIDWYLYLMEKGFQVNPLPSRRYELCMATSLDHELIDPWGNRFDCTEVSLVKSYEDLQGKNRFQIGHISNGNRSSRKFGRFYDEILENQLPCHHCPMLPVCGGACPKEWKDGHVPCPPPKYHAQELLLLAYAKGTKTKIVGSDQLSLSSKNIGENLLV